MPRHYKKKKTYGRRKRRSHILYQGVNPGMPNTRRANLRVAVDGTITCTSGVLNSISLTANDAFDPTAAISSRQPMGWDNWNQLYNHYVVVGSQINVKAVNSAGASSYAPAIFGVVLNQNSTGPYANHQGYIESRKGSYRMLNTQPTSTKSITLNYSTKKFFNITDIKDNLARLGALVSQSPSEVASFVIWYQTLDGNTQTQRFVITLDLIVDFSEPKIGTES